MTKSWTKGISICLLLALISELVSRNLWHLGAVYWIALGLLAATHLVITGLVVMSNSRNVLATTSAIVLLFIGQSWALEMLAMQVIWRIRGFAP